jgi:hypothetical protein
MNICVPLNIRVMHTRYVSCITRHDRFRAFLGRARDGSSVVVLQIADRSYGTALSSVVPGPVIAPRDQPPSLRYANKAKTRQ